MILTHCLVSLLAPSTVTTGESVVTALNQLEITLLCRLHQCLEPTFEADVFKAAIIPIVPERNQLTTPGIQAQMISSAIGEQRNPRSLPPSWIIEIRADHAVQHVFGVRNVFQRTQHAIILQAQEVARRLTIAPAVKEFKTLRQRKLKLRLEGGQRRFRDTGLQGLEVIGAMFAQPTLEPLQQRIHN